MQVLGISAYFHDSAAALVRDGEIVAAAQEERFSRVKHDAALPLEAVRFCLDEAGVDIDDVDQIVFYEKPMRKFERLLVTQLRAFPRGVGQFVGAMGTWLSKRLWLKGEIAAALGCDPDRIAFSEHHLSHAASAFFCSPFDSAAVVTADGVGEWATTAIYKAETGADGSRLTLLRELHFPHSMGLLYSALTAYLGFRVNNGEYKVMGLAAFGAPTYLEAFEQLARIGDDASLTLDMRYFSHDRSATKAFTPALESLLGPARAPGSTLELPAEDGESRRFADVAASLQAFCERYMLALADEARRLTGETQLCMAGGVALNSVANGRVAREAGFDDVYVHPAAGDAGGAVGAALWFTHEVCKQPRREPMRDAYLGRAWSQEEVERFLAEVRVRHRVFDTDEELRAEVARRLADGEVGGWMQGRFEWGPRALGHRSILADARNPAMTERVNSKVKFREPFRPFAPAVLAEQASRWFETDPNGRDAQLTPWMLSVSRVTDEGREALPAITHVDGTARLQTVDAQRHPALHALLEEFERQTGVGVLLNTSLNLKGEPMAASPADAYAVYHRSGLDFLAMGRCLVTRTR